MMYVAVDTRTGVVYVGHTVAELRWNVEAELELTDDQIPPHYYNWSDSKSITFLIQAGFITPQAGPDWFMALKPPPTAPGEDGSEPVYAQKKISIIRYDGTVSHEAQVQITFWQDRNHVRLVFMDKDQIFGEIFLNEESMRALWVLLGTLCHFQEEGLVQSLKAMPPARIHMPSSTPERFPRLIREHGFDILKAIDEMNLDLGDGDESDDEAPF